MTKSEIKLRFPNCSQQFLSLNAEADLPVDGAGPVAELEPDIGHGAVGQAPLQKGTRRRFLVRVTAIRRRLLDEDNLCEKYHVDLLRYASGGSFGDDPGQTKIEVAQIKAGKGEPEEVRIEVFAFLERDEPEPYFEVLEFL